MPTTFRLVHVFWFALAVACRGPDRDAPSLLREGSSTTGRDAFFTAFDAGDYGAIDGVLDLLDEEQADPVSVAVKAFAHSWRLAESSRDPSNPDVVEHAAAAVEHFTDAIEELPDDARLVGFRGSFLLARGSIEERSELTRQGWFAQNAARRRWPAWGLFTQAYGLVSLDPGHKKLERGLELMWENLEVCSEQDLPRDSVDWSEFSSALASHPDDRLRRACSNTPAAAHNVEGFFLAFGDLAAKNEDLDLHDRSPDRI